jgi:predicted nucleic acid-binding protein
MVILDTNVISALMRAEAAIVAWLDCQSALSVWTTTITLFEVRYGLAVMPLGRRGTADEAAFNDVIEHELEGRILSFDRAAADHAALLLAERRRGGRMGESRDTMIAGIALSQNATLATRNVRHFDDLRVPVVDPWHA